MSLKLLGFIGTAATGVLGVGAAVVFGSGLVKTSYIEERKQWQFLYKLAKKVYPYLKRKNTTAQGSSTKAVTKDNLIEWLIDEFSLTSTHTDKSDTWENFRNICKQQIIKETNGTVKVPAVRVCYVDEGNSSEGYGAKGQLSRWTSKEYSGFSNLRQTNLELWTYFLNKYPDKNPIDKFDEWWNNLNGEDIDVTTKTAINNAQS